MIKYIHEPTDLQCGQAVIAMLAGVTVAEVVDFLQNDRETTLKEMKTCLEHYGIDYLPQKQEAETKADLPDCAILSLETPRCWHWSLYCEGRFYDPEHGEADDFPLCKRKYFFEVKRPSE